MQQLTYTGPEQVEWLAAPLPKLEGPGEALVEPVAVASCDLDPLIVRGRTPYQAPIALGHEAIGRVVDVGDDVRRVKPNDTVAVPFQISCGECEKCKRGNTGNCSTVPFLSMYGFGKFAGDWGGALSDLLRVPYADHMLVPLPSEADVLAVASIGDNIVDGWRTVAPQLEARPGADVLVMGGAGSIPIYAAGIAVGLGAGRVDYVDTDADGRRRAEQLGANPIEEWAGQDHDPYPITVDGSGDPAGLRAAIRSTAPDGVCTSIGIYFEETALPLLEMYTRNITFHTGRAHARPDMTDALQLVESGRFHPEIVTSRVVPWNDAGEALVEERGKLVFSRLD